jgi:excisionase family DNA binding protein
MLRLTDVAEVLNISNVTVWRLIKTGKLASVQVGAKAVRVSETSLADFIERNTSAITTPTRRHKTMATETPNGGNAGNAEGSIKAIEVKVVELEKGGGLTPGNAAALKALIQAIRDAIANMPKPTPQ